MKYHEYDLENGKGERTPSPGQCIYCGAIDVDLTDEHVIPYALGANAHILLKSCCTICQHIIQPYEQHVLKHQLGNFRAQVGAPTRRKKSRPDSISYEFLEVDSAANVIRSLGSQSAPTEKAPLALTLWASPPPRIALPASTNTGIGHPWTYFQKDELKKMCEDVAKATGAQHVAVHVGNIDRIKYQRSLAKTGHAFACAVIGIDAFEPLLLDVILKRTNNTSFYVGDISESKSIVHGAEHSLQIFLGVPDEGPIAGFVVVSLQLYPSLNSPVHLVVVGRPNELTEPRLRMLASG